MIADSIPELKNLSTEETLALISELWVSLDDSNKEAGVSDEILDEAEDRLVHFCNNPESAKSWDEVENAIKRQPK